MVDVTPPKGALIRTGTVNQGNFGGERGGIQFELIQPVPTSSYINPRPIP